MLRLAYILALAMLLGLTGCVQARLNAYYNPKPAEPCQVPIIVDGIQRDCVSREHARQILKEVADETL